MEREKGIEPSCIAWKAIVLPLNYSRLRFFCSSIGPNCGGQARENISFIKKWWAGEDSNLCRHRRQIYSLLPFPLGHLPYYQKWSWREESNPQPGDYKSPALPLSHASLSLNIIISFFSIPQADDRSYLWPANLLQPYSLPPDQQLSRAHIPLIAPTRKPNLSEP